MASSTRSKRNPLICCLAPWHTWQRARNSGSISRENSTEVVAAGGISAAAARQATRSGKSGRKITFMAILPEHYCSERSAWICDADGENHDSCHTPNGDDAARRLE